MWPITYFLFFPQVNFPPATSHQVWAESSVVSYQKNQEGMKLLTPDVFKKRLTQYGASLHLHHLDALVTGLAASPTAKTTAWYILEYTRYTCQLSTNVKWLAQSLVSDRSSNVRLAIVLCRIETPKCDFRCMTMKVESLANMNNLVDTNQHFLHFCNREYYVAFAE